MQGVGLYGALARDTVNPAQFGVALSFVMASLSSGSSLPNPPYLADSDSLQRASATLGDVSTEDGE